MDATLPLKWDFFEYLPVALQDGASGEVMMIQYMTKEGFDRSLEERSTWLWSRSREQFWLAGRNGGGHDVRELRGNCYGDSLLAIVEATDRSVCHLGNRTCFSNKFMSAGSG